MTAKKSKMRPRTLLTQLIILLALWPSMSYGFIIVLPANKRGGIAFSTASSHTKLQMMGIIDFLQNNTPFLNSREGDFIPLNKEESNNEDTIGPPILILYAVPNSIDDDEFRDMVSDGMPCRTVVEALSSSTSSSGDDENEVMIQRLDGMNDNNSGEGDDELLDLSVKDALNRLVQDAATATTETTIPSTTVATTSPTNNNNGPCCPVLYFSGVSNKEMMDTYQIIANEIYAETNGVHWPACAKVVTPALDKSMRQVLSEISGDHADAMGQGAE